MQITATLNHTFIFQFFHHYYRTSRKQGKMEQKSLQAHNAFKGMIVVEDPSLNLRRPKTKTVNWPVEDASNMALQLFFTSCGLRDFAD